MTSLALLKRERPERKILWGDIVWGRSERGLTAGGEWTGTAIEVASQEMTK